MGSEGRGEQIIRNDQDNALIVRDGYHDEHLPQYAEQFNQATAKLGYPLCDGNIMISNPLWRKSLSESLNSRLENGLPRGCPVDDLACDLVRCPANQR